MILYSTPHSAFCTKVRIVLRLKGLEFEELEPPGGYGSDHYKSIVPSGNLPALVDGEFQLADSEAIVEYLEDNFPQIPLFSASPKDRAKERERARFHDTRLEPALRAVYPHIPPRPANPGLCAAQSLVISERLAQLAKMLERHPNEQFSIGDCGFPASFVWMDQLSPVLGLTIKWPDRIHEYSEWLLSHPIVSEEISAFEGHVSDWLTSR